MRADTTDKALQGESDMSATHKMEGYSFGIHPYYNPGDNTLSK